MNKQLIEILNILANIKDTKTDVKIIKDSYAIRSIVKGVSIKATDWEGYEAFRINETPYNYEGFIKVLTAIAKGVNKYV